LSRLLSLQVFYAVLGIVYNASSYLLVRLGGTPLSATDPLTGGLSMLIYAACLIPGWLHWIKAYRLLMCFCLVVYGYGGLVKHFINISHTGLALYSSAASWALAVAINGFGLVLNLMAVAGWFRQTQTLPSGTDS
jgi:hypothetical protein